ncbi:MAG: DUF4263 domain-containing protein [Candidatus Vecturithrix sp.]|jgi:hypothetical protein|nr:DUF4263 domain-containing protein [Candidatus Vecturithrix sp.]
MARQNIRRGGGVMVRMFPRNYEGPKGSLLVEEDFPNCVDVYFVPPVEGLKIAGFDVPDPKKHKTQILRFCGQDDYLDIYPIHTQVGHSSYLEQKYSKIESITLEGFGFGTPSTDEEVVEALEELPSGFVKDYDFGLGLQKDYRFIIHAVEEVPGIKHLVISQSQKTSFKDTTFTINHNDFDEVRKKINAIANRAQIAARKVKTVTAHNVLSFFLKDPTYPQKTLQSKNDTLHRMIAGEENGELSSADQEIVIKLISSNAATIAATKPETLEKIRNDLELGALTQLIAQYTKMMAKKLSEPHWQKLFNENPFILSLAFSYPVIKINDQAHVGGRKVNGSGDKITDFLVKHGFSNNAALFEIKTPTANLLKKTKYRDGVFAPSTDLVGAMNQLLDQKNKFQQEIASLKHNSKIHDLESYAAHGVLVIGQTPQGTDEQKSFELFRGNSKDILIITFDELLEKLKQLHAFLASSNTEVA